MCKWMCDVDEMFIILLFFFKQKTAYEMRISDWSSDVCSSDLLVDDIASLRAAGRDVLVVSSGAIALGRRILGIDAKALRLEDSQAAAAAGQIRLSAAWGDRKSTRLNSSH